MNNFLNKFKNSSYIPPYISGYHFTSFILPEDWAYEIDKESSSEILESLVLSVTFPESTNSMISTTTIKKGKLELRFLEISGLKVSKIMDYWYKIKGEYSGICMTPSLAYWTTQPDGKTMEFCSIMGGIAPINPFDWKEFGSDIRANDKLEFDVEFSYENLTVLEPKDFYAFLPIKLKDNFV